MTGPSLDLDALREKARDRRADPYERLARYEELDEGLLALVEEQRECIDKLNGAIERDDDLIEEQRKENERLREAVKLAAVDLAIVHHMFDGGPVVQGILDRLGNALAGPPAENKEP